MKWEKITHLDILPLSFSNFSLDMEILGDWDKELRGSHLSPLFLGRFSLRDIKYLLIKNKVIEKLLDMGYENLHYRMEVENGIDNKLYIYTIVEGMELVLLYVRVRVGELMVKEGLPLSAKIIDGERMLIIEWIRLQDVRKKRFIPLHTGQTYKGLGIIGELYGFMMDIALRLKVAGIMEYPEFFHNAVLFARYGFHFLNPHIEAKMKAILRDLKKYRLSQISLFFAKGYIYNNIYNTAEVWKPSEQVKPIKQSFLDYFSSYEYKLVYEEALQKFSFAVRISDEVK